MTALQIPLRRTMVADSPCYAALFVDDNLDRYQFDNHKSRSPSTVDVRHLAS